MTTDRAAVEKLRQNLGMLGVAYYVFAGLMALTGCMFFFHVAFGIFALVSPESLADQSTGEPMPAFFGLTMSGLGGCAIAAFWCIALLLGFAGGGLRAGRRKILAFVAAVLVIGSFPFGTILAVLTFVLLTKPEAKEIFDGG